MEKMPLRKSSMAAPVEKRLRPGEGNCDENICLVERAWLILARRTKRTVLVVNACNLQPVAMSVFLSKEQFSSLASKPTCRKLTLYLEVSQL